jgi:hypothetical protein
MSLFCQDYLADTKELPKWPINYTRGRKLSTRNMPRAQRDAIGTMYQVAESAR